MSDKVEALIEGTTPKGTPLTNMPAVLTADELAVLLRVDRKTTYLMIQRDESPGCVRVGRKLRISTSAVLRWLDGQSRRERRL